MKYLVLLLSLVLISCDDDNLVDSLKFPPEVQITNPNNLDIVSDTVVVKAMATSNIGIKYCALWVDGKIVENSEDFEEPYVFPWNTNDFENGHHSLVVRATDIEGNSGDSEIIDIFVENNDDIKPPTSGWGFYTYDHVSDQLLSIDSLGTITVVGDLGVDLNKHSRMFSYNDKLFITIHSVTQEYLLYEINKNTGQMTFVKSFLNHLYEKQAAVAGLTQIGEHIYVLFERSGGPQGFIGRFRFSMEDSSEELIATTTGDLNLFGLSNIGNKLFAYSEFSNRLYELDNNYQVSNGSNSGLNFVWCMDRFNNNSFIVLNRESNGYGTYLIDISTGENTKLFSHNQDLSGIVMWRN
jgi:hypothetical protein